MRGKAGIGPADGECAMSVFSRLLVRYEVTNVLKRFVVVDLETTGNHPRQGDSIIQIGAVTVEDGQIRERFSTLVNPGCPLPPFITQLTGITDEMVAEAPHLEDVLPRFLPLLEGRTFVAHNAGFDLQFLQEALLSQGYYTFDGYVLDTVELSRLLLPMQNSYRLQELASDLDLCHDRPHQADSDALATAKLFLYLQEILQQLPLVTIQRLQMLVSSFRSDIGVFLRQVELAKMAELSLWGESGKGKDDSGQWDIYRHIALRKRPEKHALSLRPHKPVRVTDSFEDLLETVAGSEGILAQSASGYQPRQAQIEMMQEVYAAMRDGAHLLVEAGTGTGKSLGYLLPGIVWARQNDQPLVVSTNTVQLQEQLLHKEIARLQQVLPFSFTAATLKGRGNYLCLRKFEQALLEPVEEISQEIRMVKGQMLVWLTQTETGDIEEINLPSSGKLFWQQVKSDSHSCLNRECPWFSRCYYFQARERTREADVIIVNHALLLSDLQAENRILPAYETAVIDEAHHLDEAATQHLGKQFSTAQLLFLLDRLLSGNGSLLGRLQEEGSDSAEMSAALASFREVLDKVYAPLCEKAQKWANLVYQWASKRAVETTETGRETVRYQQDSFAGDKERIPKLTRSLIQAMAEVAAALEKLLRSALAEEKQTISFRSIRTDLNGLLHDWQEAMESLHFFLLDLDEQYVYWMEVESRTARKQVYFFAALLQVSAALAEPLFAQKRSLVLTSATLTVKNSFSYFAQRLGLDQLPDRTVRTLQLPSPFHYEEQGLLLIPSDFPAPGKESEQAYLDAVIQGCVDVVTRAKGRTMILFTSHSMLRTVHQGMKERLALESEAYMVLGHGVDSNNRSKLVSLFQSLERSVLLGTSSFWEGVDIPGETLSCLVIVRLPFDPPNLPVYQGRAELLQAQGKNAFMSLALPQAVIQFKQGVGRLIRHQLDRGVVVVFDTRVVEARYGKTFLQSLPPFRMESGPWPVLREQIAPFLSTESQFD